jgi:hypothetical protein
MLPRSRLLEDCSDKQVTNGIIVVCLVSDRSSRSFTASLSFCLHPPICINPAHPSIKVYGRFLRWDTIRPHAHLLRLRGFMF